jgi:allophanate hydrolase
VADLQADPVTPNSRFGTYTNFVNLMDMCGIAVPVRRRSDDRPGSVTFLAAAGQDGLVAALAAQLHDACAPGLGATGLPHKGAAPAKAAPMPSEIALAVVGAHMSGLPLNGELTRLGGRFLEATDSAPKYRLYALAGGPPFRPGMIRDAKGGASIALEVWALPSAKFGEFLSGIPSPLGIGTIALADGRSVKGFLVESEAISDAEEITELGGWRKFLETLEKR